VRYASAPFELLSSLVSDGLDALRAARGGGDGFTGVHVTAPPSKADQDGTRWTASPVSVEWSDSDTNNFAREMAKYELMRRVPAAERRDTPLLLNHEGKPWRRGALSLFFKLLLALAVPASEVAKYSVHSFRIYLACALLAVGASPETIKLMLRWASDEALHIYARMNIAVGTGLRRAATSATVHSVRATNLPNMLPGAPPTRVGADGAAEWAEEPAAAELQRRAALRARAAVADVRAVDRGLVPETDLDHVFHNISIHQEASEAQAARDDARLDRGEDGGDDDDSDGEGPQAFDVD